MSESSDQLKVSFFPKQNEAFNLLWRFKKDSIGNHIFALTFLLYGGAIRGGKTIWGLCCLLFLCKVFPGSKWIVVRDSISTIQNTTLPTFYQIVPQEMLQQRPTSHNKWLAILPNGSQIQFFGENYSKDKDLNRWRGLECNGFLLEEVNELNEKSFYKAFERAGSWKMHKTWRLSDEMPKVYPRVVIATCNPAENWIKEKVYEKWAQDKLPQDWAYIPALPTDNPNNTLEWIEEKRRVLPGYLFDKFLLGDWDVSENDRPFLTEFDELKHVSTEFGTYFVQNAAIWASFDFNVEPPTCTIGQKGKGFAWILDEISVDVGSVHKLAEKVKERYPNQIEFITGDASGNKREIGDVQLRNNFQIICDVLGLDYYYNVLGPNSNLRLFSEKGSRALCESVLRLHPGFRINPRCKLLIKDLRNAYVNDKGELVKNRSKGDSTYWMDFFDAFRYMIHTWFPDWLDRHQQYL